MLPAEIVKECKEWILNAGSFEKNQISFRLLQELVDYVDRLCSKEDVVRRADSWQGDFIGPSKTTECESVSECVSIASVETMIVYEEDEEKPASNGDDFELEWAACTIQKTWRIAQIQFRIQDRQALLESSASCIAQLKSDSTLNASEAWTFADFLNRHSFTGENVSPSLANSLHAINAKKTTTSKLVRKILACWHQGMLTRRSFGEWLSSPDDLSRMTLRQFLNEFTFSGQFIVDALRTFLDSFELPGEAQRIDRIMNEFAQRYFQQNQDLFCSADVVYILSFSIILLNTDAHNFNVKSKMSLAEFIKNNRPIFADPTNPATTDLLRAVYHSVLQREIISREEATEKLQKIVQCIGSTEQGQSQFFAAVSSEQTYLGAFYCHQTNASDSWPAILFRKERIALLTDGSFLLLRLYSKGSKKYECKICKSLRNVRKVYINGNSLNVTIRSSSTPNMHASDMEDGSTSSTTLAFKTAEYARAFHDLFNETLQAFLANQLKIRQQKLKNSQLKAQQAKSILESIYKPNRLMTD